MVKMVTKNTGDDVDYDDDDDDDDKVVWGDDC